MLARIHLILLLASTPPVAAAQVTALGVQPRTEFTATGGRVVGLDVDDAGKRLATLGEHDDVVVMDVDGKVLGRSLLPGAARAVYVALQPVRPGVAVCLDRSERGREAETELVFVDAGASAPLRPPRRRLMGGVLGMAWNDEGSLLAVGRVTRIGSVVDVFLAAGGELRPLETVPLPSLIELLAGRVVPEARLVPFQGHWRSHRNELLAKPGYVDGPPNSVDYDADPPTPNDALLVADAQARFARWMAKTGVGVDRLGQVFVRQGKTLTVHSNHRGDVLGLQFSPNAEYVAAASRAAVTVASVDGRQLEVVAGKHLLAPGESGAEIVFLGQWIRRYDAASRTFVQGERLPPADTGTGEDDARRFGMPQLRTALRLDADTFVLGGYSQFGHEGLVVDVVNKKVRQVADTEREADDRLVVDVRELALLSATRWLSRESVRAMKGDFRHTSVLRLFDGQTPLWSREVREHATAVAPTADGLGVVVADAEGGLVLLDGAKGSERAHVHVRRALRWIVALDGDTLLAHDGVELVAYAADTLRESARALLPEGDAIVATAFDVRSRRLALGRGPRVCVLDVRVE
ncbi:MAG: hypothetical protein R3F56_08065 [Planctomycetota bacterium]